MNSIALVIVIVLAGLTPAGLQAEIYSWTDENGVKHYSQTPLTKKTSKPFWRTWIKKINLQHQSAVRPNRSFPARNGSKMSRKSWKKNWPTSKISRRMPSRIPAAGV